MVLQQNRRSIANCPVGPFLIVVSAPSLHFFLSVRKGQERMGIQALSPEASVEGFDERIVGRLAWSREVQRHAALIGPQVEVARDELAALIDAGRRWRNSRSQQTARFGRVMTRKLIGAP